MKTSNLKEIYSKDGKSGKIIMGEKFEIQIARRSS